jgi:Fe-S cluster assembly protein SufD
MTTETLPIRPEDPFLEALQSKDPSSEEAQTWLVPIRQAGIAAYSQSGLPTTADEDWRFTSLANLREVTFDLSLAPSTLSAMELESLPDPLQGKESIRLVLVDGQLDEGLSSRSLLPQGITLMSMKEAIQSHQTSIKAHLGQYTYGNDSPFAALNSALFCDGVYLHLPAGMELGIPIHIMHVTSGSSQGRVSLARSFFHLEQRASATVLETFCGPNKGAYLTSPTLECRVEDQAKLEHIKIQDESPEAFHMACVYASIDREAHFKSHYLSLGGKLSRNHIRTHLNGEGLCCTLNGLYLAQGHQVMDQHMVVDHAKPHTESHEYFNGILDDQARGVFHGRIHVRQIAQKKLTPSRPIRISFSPRKPLLTPNRNLKSTPMTCAAPTVLPLASSTRRPSGTCAQGVFPEPRPEGCSCMLLPEKSLIALITPVSANHWIN